jgi:hypothetical protein
LWDEKFLFIVLYKYMRDWKGGRVVECAPLLRVCTVYGTEGSNPSLSAISYLHNGPVAQWLEQSAHNRLVESSILSRPTIFMGIFLLKKKL